jgi:hypothetical protein
LVAPVAPSIRQKVAPEATCCCCNLAGSLGCCSNRSSRRSIQHAPAWGRSTSSSSGSSGSVGLCLLLLLFQLLLLDGW